MSTQILRNVARLLRLLPLIWRHEERGEFTFGPASLPERELDICSEEDGPSWLLLDGKEVDENTPLKKENSSYQQIVARDERTVNKREMNYRDLSPVGTDLSAGEVWDWAGGIPTAAAVLGRYPPLPHLLSPFTLIPLQKQTHTHTYTWKKLLPKCHLPQRNRTQRKEESIPQSC